MNAIAEVEVENSLQQSLDRLKAAYAAEPYPSLDERKQRLIMLKQALIANKQALVEALSDDFGYRSEFDTAMTDVLPTVSHINYTLKRLKKWCKPSKRESGLLLAPSKVTVQYQPLGVVGIISPWNFPVILSLAPLVTALAAGNRVMMKLSEFTPKTNKVIVNICRELSEYVEVFEGEADVAQAFSQLPFDHLLFTGSTNVGRAVAKSAAENLTPVTLELGGKSPVIITEDADMKKTVDAILFGKCINAGQICVAPDYAFVPQERVEEFITLFLKRFEKLYLKSNKNQKLTHIINQRQYERLTALLEDAKTQGASLHTVEASPQEERILYPHLVTNVSADMRIMQEEIFGPLLPIKPYKSLEEAIDYINQHQRPLALYVMSDNKSTIKHIVRNTHSGGVGINDTVLHVGAEDAPFGGIGQSGIGHYHGVEGFRTFSHAKTVLQTPKWLPRTGALMRRRAMAIKAIQKIFVR
ncbi:coniferyl aldehyde dehydrogenase [Vibrio parahaemolyticus]|uniref:coniferyl aldehyde dehydrogenase n=1 Tax=Vibrio parahaemolyticus TaxID=670 RepID=UPI001121A968|nr:coniferyl aldehyde dehydrogenase [Vibrio parahaemolyticus]EIZ1043782.1 coniferyl aldehyde dehydrogenase [Vibrio parahaemolyticus]MCR9664322.1 coniferyl aldehyde dehydrogenase [Vibrio parahaemolyticus]MCR9678289.1 coniferyl aldehyde dehydrogenase [Vibrio parahaemolyticus]MDF5092796.1 coniferyl aldehyde dehydrogenase [Vibrio parahaemolyticus]MDF5137417.1 coniferyl aldehyde dehydrogenase [Vibrio parahaemolyticus]